jgi:hypothetical protein
MAPCGDHPNANKRGGAARRRKRIYEFHPQTPLRSPIEELRNAAASVDPPKDLKLQRSAKLVDKRFYHYDQMLHEDGEKYTRHSAVNDLIGAIEWWMQEFGPVEIYQMLQQWADEVALGCVQKVDVP